MAKYKIFVDGSAGTTGLRIAERLAARPEFAQLTLPEAQRKDPAARAAADVVCGDIDEDGIARALEGFGLL